jgi:hypothetical protein
MKKNTLNRRAKTSRKSVVKTSPLISALSVPSPVPNIARTENNAKSYATTESAVLDFFAAGGALRNQEEAQINAIFAKAFAEDKLLATKVAFYIRDIRGGQGQRKSFRSILRWLSLNAPAVVKKNLELVAEFGRWDDLLVLLNTPLEADVVKLISLQLKADLRAVKSNQEISLLGKWLPSGNTSSKATRAQAVRLTQLLGFSARQYRKTLVSLRACANIVERAMCSKDWTGIDYEKVPSRASMIYRGAFSKHDPVGYSTWKGKAFRGEAKVNAGTLYPYDIVSKVLHGESNETLELLWRNLPNLFTGSIHKGLVVCDVSGSMSTPALVGSKVVPMHVAISLAMYFAERCEGPFKDHFITFSKNPQLQKLEGATLYDRVMNLSRAQWDMNTDVQKVFELILSRAVANKLKQEDLPEAIYIVSDLQFDYCGHNETSLEAIKAKFTRAGYKAPLLVFWQVRPSGDKVALKNEKGVVMVSGFSQNALASILKLEQPAEVTPYELMLATVNGERYESITV